MENMFNIGEVTEAIYNAKKEVKFSHLLEGFNHPVVSELLFAAKN
ncbi:hypothetical protein [Bacillus xiapuensis]|uniref:Uncharacterized protein n=1 Tax=Bacillus xiapuensis TaxID=2014075 RepID=A0ABU6N816_9BACI|nr:hypothetical protein [Bacillus xiapuensis]